MQDVVEDHQVPAGVLVGQQPSEVQVFGAASATQGGLAKVAHLGVVVVQPGEQGLVADVGGRPDGEQGGTAHLDNGVVEQRNHLIEQVHAVVQGQVDGAETVGGHREPKPARATSRQRCTRASALWA